MATSRKPFRARETSENQSVTTLELFFDLVFVFALTQITALMAHDLTWHGVLRGMLLIGLLWWSWVGFSWLCNLVKADEGAVRGVMMTSMTAMFLIALAIPEAFDDLPGGLPGPVVIAGAYFAFRALHLVLFWLIATGDRQLRRTLIRFSGSMLGASALLLLASQYDGRTQIAAIAVPLVLEVPALGQLGVLTALLAGLVTFESIRFAQERDEVRHGEQHA